MLSVNDVYKSREELLRAFSEFMSGEKHKFHLREKKRAISLVCKARRDCYCDAHITAHLKKREGTFQIKKVKTAHKCPLGYHFHSNFLEEEIRRRSSRFLGNVIKQLNDSGIRVGYLTAWKVVNKDFVRSASKEELAVSSNELHSAENRENLDASVETSIVKDKGCEAHSGGGELSCLIESTHNHGDAAEEANNCEDDGVRKAAIESGNTIYMDEESESSEENESVLSEALKTFRAEFLLLNPNCRCEAEDTAIYISFPFLRYLRNVLELKVYMRRKGCVVYGIGYDPVDKPIIVSFVVSERDVESALSFFFRHEPRFYNSHARDTDTAVFHERAVKRRRTADDGDKARESPILDMDSASEDAETIPITYLIEYDEKLIEVLDGLKVDYFVKTRSICRRYDLSEVERVFRVVNFNTGGSLDINVDPSRYIVGDRHLFGINNFSEVDLDFIFYAVYNFGLFDFLTSVLKLSADNLKERSYKSFGENVLLKLERNKKMMQTTEQQEVDLENFWCSCGRYQTFLIPCSHACSVIFSRGRDPLDFVSRVYDPRTMAHMEKIHPVVDVPVRCQIDRFLLRRGPGRPKKHMLVTSRK